jgi:hypothetical protein
MFEDEELEINRYIYKVFNEPMSQPWDFEIGELGRLPVQKVSDHPIYQDKKVVVHVYET